MRRIFVAFTILASLFLGFFVGRYTLLFEPTTDKPVNTQVQTAQDTNIQKTSQVQSSTTAATSTGTSTPTTGPTSFQMNDAQRQMLQKFGINPDTVILTQQTIACAEQKIGATRLNEIKNGALPSLSEGLTMLQCYKQ